MSTEPHFVGIDPGKEGFASEITLSGEVIGTWEQPLTSSAKGDTFDVTAMVTVAKEWKERGVVAVAIEVTQPQGGQRSSAQTGFMQAAPYFLWRGICAAVGLRVLLVKDTIWKKSVGVVRPAREKKEPEPIKPKRGDYPNGKGGEARFAVAKSNYDQELKGWKKRDTARKSRNSKLQKSASIQAAMNYFPGLDMRRNERCKVASDGKAESLLIAVYASRTAGAVVAQ